MDDLLKDTMFGNRPRAQDEDEMGSTTTTTSESTAETNQEGEEAPGVVLKNDLRSGVPVPVDTSVPNNNKTGADGHIYEEISDFDAVFKTSQVEFQGDKQANVVKLRKENVTGEESRRQKLIRRLSFTHKDKNKSNLHHSRRSREAEDFEIVHSSELLKPVTTTTTTTTAAFSTKTALSSVTPLHGSHHNPSNHNHGSSTSSTPKAWLFTLNRRASKRETPKGMRCWCILPSVGIVF